MLESDKSAGELECSIYRLVHIKTRALTGTYAMVGNDEKSTELIINQTLTSPIIHRSILSSDHHWQPTKYLVIILTRE